MTTLASTFARLIPIAVLFICGCPWLPTLAAEKPNIIYIVSDDLGYGDLGCYGQQRIETPRLDRMAREGLRFTDHYAGHTVCRPSRLVFLTGYHTGHTAIAGLVIVGLIIQVFSALLRRRGS